MNTYTFSRYNFNTDSYEFRKVVASCLEQAERLSRFFGSLFSITKPTGYHALNVHQRINAKGNAGLLYQTFDTLWLRFFAQFMERPAEARVIVKRIAKRDPKLFTPGMLLSKNTQSI